MTRRIVFKPRGSVEYEGIAYVSVIGTIKDYYYRVTFNKPQPQHVAEVLRKLHNTTGIVTHFTGDTPREYTEVNDPVHMKDRRLNSFVRYMRDVVIRKKSRIEFPDI